MRFKDYMMAIALSDHWKGIERPDFKLCPLLADLDRLLAYTEANGMRRGDNIDPCPECGEEHRGALMGRLMNLALELREPEGNALLEAAQKRSERVAELYGGEEKYREMQDAAEEFFIKKLL